MSPDSLPVPVPVPVPLPATVLAGIPDSKPSAVGQLEGVPLEPEMPKGCTNHKLRQLTRRVAQHCDAELVNSGLKTTQYSLLSHVVKLGPIRPVDLAMQMKMDASTLTRNLRLLVDAGWLSVGPGPDARSRCVSVTDTGRRKRAQAQRHWRVAQESLNRMLGREQVLALHALIDDSLTRLNRAPALPCASASGDCSHD
jgi:DNA-binding MarR family transcriptional regulator